MTEENKDAVGLANDVYRYEMKAGRAMDDLFQGYDPEVAEDALLESYNSIVSNSDSRDTIRKVTALTQQFAQVVGSEKLIQRAQEVTAEYNLSAPGDGNGRV